MANFRKTKSVKSILDAFDAPNTALSVVELVKRFQGEMNKTTVYRILERLEKEAVLHSFAGVNGLKWFAKSAEASQEAHQDHSHFQCKSCGKSECLSIDIEIPNLPNYNIDQTNLILLGRCDDCL